MTGSPPLTALSVTTYRNPASASNRTPSKTSSTTDRSPLTPVPHSNAIRAISFTAASVNTKSALGVYPKTPSPAPERLEKPGIGNVLGWVLGRRTEFIPLAPRRSHFWLDRDTMQEREKRNEFRSTTKIVARALGVYLKTPSLASERLENQGSATFSDSFLAIQHVFDHPGKSLPRMVESLERGLRQVGGDRAACAPFANPGQMLACFLEVAAL